MELSEPNHTHQKPPRRGGAWPSRAADEGRFTIFFLPEPLSIADLRNLEKKKPKNTD